MEDATKQILMEALSNKLVKIGKELEIFCPVIEETVDDPEDNDEVVAALETAYNNIKRVTDYLLSHLQE
jgi:hypothetical protein